MVVQNRREGEGEDPICHEILVLRSARFMDFAFKTPPVRVPTYSTVVYVSILGKVRFSVCKHYHVFMSSRILKNFNPKQTSSVKQYKPTMDFLSSSGPPFFVLAVSVCPLLCLCYTVIFELFGRTKNLSFGPFLLKFY